MRDKFENPFSMDELREQLEEQRHDLSELPGWLFWGMLLYIDPIAEDLQVSQATALRMRLASNTARFAGATITSEANDQKITHIVADDNRERLKQLRKLIGS